MWCRALSHSLIWAATEHGDSGSEGQQQHHREPQAGNGLVTAAVIALALGVTAAALGLSWRARHTLMHTDHPVSLLQTCHHHSIMITTRTTPSHLGAGGHGKSRCKEWKRQRETPTHWCGLMDA